MSELDKLVGELEQAAARLRSGEIEREEAAQLVEQCAELATRLGSELDREARDLATARGAAEGGHPASRGQRPGQETLL